MAETQTIWVCSCCMLMHANGECCDSAHQDFEPLSAIAPEDNTTLGMDYTEHDEDCLFHKQDPDYQGCGCECREHSTQQCQGCGNTSHGRRHALTLWIGENV